MIGDQERAPTCKESGFTLLELIIAIGVLTVGLLAVGTMQGAAINTNSRGYRITEATNLAQDRIELLVSQPFNTLAAGNNLPDPDLNNPSANITYDVTQAMTDAGGNPTAWRITMTVQVQNQQATVLEYVRPALLE